MASAPPSTDQQHPAHALLARAHPPEQSTALFREKIQQRPLLLRPSSPPLAAQDARTQRQRARQAKRDAQKKKKSTKPQPLSAKQKRRLDLYAIPRAQQKYAIYTPLHALWCGYMREILGLSSGRTFVEPAQAGPVLVSADYHGAELEVVRARCGSLVGLRGIVVKDGKFAFEVVTPGDRVKCLPKRGAVFRVEVPFEAEEREGEGKMDGDATPKRQPLVFDIHGSQFEARAPDRANRKFRWHHDPDL